VESISLWPPTSCCLSVWLWHTHRYYDYLFTQENKTFYHPRSGAVMFSVSQFCGFLSVCNMITFESLDLKSFFLVCGYVLRGCGSSSYIKVIGSRSRSLTGANSAKIFNYCNIKFDRKFGHELCVQHWGFCLWQIECCGRHLCHVTRSARAYIHTCIRGWSALDSGMKAILFVISLNGYSYCCNSCWKCTCISSSKWSIVCGLGR